MKAVRRHVLGGQAVVKRKRVYREAVAQVGFVEWLRARPDWKVTRIENEGKRTPAQTAQAKAMGMTPGDTDLLLIYKTTVIWWELKEGKGELSDNQLGVHAELIARCQRVVVTRGLDDSIATAIKIEETWT